MPEYSFSCEKCDHNFTELWSMQEYDCKVQKVKCPSCKSKKVYRDFLSDNFVPKEKVEQMRRDQKTKKQNTLEEKLPQGMSMGSYEDSARISKSDMMKRRGK